VWITPPSTPAFFTFSITATMLCDICLGILQFRSNAFTEYQTYKCPENPHYGRSYPAAGDQLVDLMLGHHRTSLSFEQSAILGCYIWKSIWRRLSEVQQSSVRMCTLTDDEFFTFAMLGSVGFGVKFTLRICFRKEAQPAVCYQTYLFTMNRTPRKWSIVTTSRA
jgi:hypothetical protein